MSHGNKFRFSYFTQNIIFILSISLNLAYAKNKEFNDVIIFGDSLSDAGSNGRFIPGGFASDNYADVISQTLTGKKKVLPYVYGGTNYATSGALIDFKNPLSFFESHLHSINEQTSYYLNNNKSSSENNMYIYWAGGWDIYFNMIYDSSIKILTEFNFNSYPNYNNPFIKFSKKWFLVDNTQNLISQIKSQFSNGAKYITILNIPNAGLSPAISFFHLDILSLFTMPIFGVSAIKLAKFFGSNVDSSFRVLSNNHVNIGKESIRKFGYLSLKRQFVFLPDFLLHNYWDTLSNMAQFYTEQYNNVIKEKLLSLSNENIIYLDTYKLFNEAIENPQVFGLTNLVLPACTLSVSSSNCYGDDYHNESNYLFGDWFHPSVITHMGIANYFLSVFNAPIQVSSILKHMYLTNTSKSLFIESNLKEFRFNEYGLNKIFLLFGISGAQSGKSYLNYANKNSFNNDLNLGFMYTMNPKFSIGILASLGFGVYRPYINFNYKYNQENLSIFSQYLFSNQIWLNSQIGIGRIGISKINRRINFIPKTKGIIEQGNNTHGLNSIFSLNLGYNHNFYNNYVISPIIGYSYMYYKVKGYREKASHSTSMSFSDFNKNNSYVSIGLQFNTINYPINFFSQITYNNSLNRDLIKIKSSISDISNKFERQIHLVDNHWIDFKLGLSKKIINNYNFNLDVQYRRDNTKNNQINYSIGINKLF